MEQGIYSNAINEAASCISKVNQLRADGSDPNERAARARWFGDITKEDDQHVTDAFSRMPEYFINHNFHCTSAPICKANVNAITHSAEIVPSYSYEGDVYVCHDAFPIDNFDKDLPGIVIHEVSHSPEVA